MPPLLADALRLLHDRSVRVGLGAFAAAVFVAMVVMAGLGPSMTVVAILLAPILPFWRRRPRVALGAGALATLVFSVRSAVTPASTYDPAPFLLLAVAVLGGSLAGTPGVRRAAGALALTGLVGVSLASAARADDLAVAGTRVVAFQALLVAPVVLAWLWRRDHLRNRVLGLARDAAPRLLAEASRTATAISVATALYLAAVALDGLSGDPWIVATALPGSAAVLWLQRRSDVAMALTAVGLGLCGLVTALTGSVSSGVMLALVTAAAVVYVASLDDRVRVRTLALALSGGTALGAALATGSGATGAGVLVLAVLPIGAAWLTRRSSATAGLRRRLADSERRGQRAERGMAAEQERTRVAREVHDVVAHSLAVVIAQADGARYVSAADPAAVAPALESIGDTARAALGEVRALLHELRRDPGDGQAPPPPFDQLLDGVRDLGVTVAVNAYGTEPDLSAGERLTRYRIVQEALTNALRHGDAEAPIEVDLEWAPTVLTITVTNALRDGASLDTPDGHGIAGMRERIALHGGELSAGAGSTGRFRVHARLPIALARPAGADESGVATLIARFSGA